MGIYNTYVPAQATYPYVVFTFLSTTHESWLGSSTGRAIATIQFDCVAETFVAAKELGDDLLERISKPIGKVDNMANLTQLSSGAE